MESVHDAIDRDEFNRGVVEKFNSNYDTEGHDELEEVQVTLEEPWSDDIEERLRGWLVEAKENGRAHKASGFVLKRRYRLFTIIVLFWSAVILVVNDSIGCGATERLLFTRLCVNATGVFLNALFSSLNMGYTYRMHFEYESKYFEVAQDIDFILMRDRDYRQAADSFMTEIREVRKKLALAPELAGNKFFGC
tara:strand:- start:723 stop:1301 length:579 start_codon:yes stop_codon:yes gene_type:complete